MIGIRLREERERLCLTQPALAEAAGAGKRTVIDWEKAVSSPTAVQLSALANVGFDVLYIVTGHRTGPEVHALDAAEQVLVDSYRRCSAAAKQNLIQTAALLSAGLAPAAPNKSRVKAKPEPGQSAAGFGMNNSGANAVQIGHGAHFSTGAHSHHSTGAGAVHIGSIESKPTTKRRK